MKSAFAIRKLQRLAAGSIFYCELLNIIVYIQFDRFMRFESARFGLGLNNCLVAHKEL